MGALLASINPHLSQVFAQTEAEGIARLAAKTDFTLLFCDFALEGDVDAGLRVIAAATLAGVRARYAVYRSAVLDEDEVAARRAGATGFLRAGHPHALAADIARCCVGETLAPPRRGGP